MLMAVKCNLQFLKHSILTNLKRVAAYKINFLIDVISMFINNSTFLIFWYTVFKLGGDNINDISFNLTLYIWSFSTLAYGVTYFFFDGVTYINKYIVDCTLDSFLLQPKNVLINIMLSKCNFSAMGDILYGIVVGMIASNFNIKKIIIIIIFGSFGSIFYISFEILLRSLSVWFGDTENIATKYVHTLLTTFASYPEQIFGNGVKLLLYTVVPVGYFVYMPVNLLDSFNFKLAFVIFLVGIIFFLLSVIVFYKAINSYNSSNMISIKH